MAILVITVEVSELAQNENLWTDDDAAKEIGNGIIETSNLEWFNYDFKDAWWRD